MKPLATLTDDEFSQRVQESLRRMPDAPQAWQQSAIGLWPAGGVVAALGALTQGLATRIAAVLSFDSWAVPATAAGTRSLASPTRHLLFSAQGRDIDLRITRGPHAGDAWVLAGQILGPDEAGRVALALDGAADTPAPLETVLDDLGEFHLAGIQPGRYVMTLQLAGAEIVLPPLDVGEPAA